MSESLFSPSWYRVAELRPRLRSHALVHRHVYRGQLWYVLQDRSSGRFHRFSPVANFVIGLMDGRRTVQQIWDLACTRLGDDTPTQDDVINLLGSLHRADVLQTNIAPDVVELHERKVRDARQRLLQYVQNPMALKFPLFDPERLLEFLRPAARRLFGWGGALAWMVLVGWALVLAGAHWNELTKDVIDHVLSVQNLLVMALVFPVTKTLHELGHAAAVKAKGGEVHEMGVMLLVFLPVPYVDATSSLAFRDKRERMLVGAAGMLVELLVAALAMLVWLNVEPGAVRAVAYNVMLIAGISTVVFNANPLLRFDGYYILSDFLEIPNLGQRANAYLGYLTRRYGFRVAAIPPETAPGERAWFVFYAIASFFYRLFVSFSIALLVAGKYFFIGVLLALWSLYSMLVAPLAKRLAYVFGAAELNGTRVRSLIVGGTLCAAAAAAVFLVPAPSWTLTEGVSIAPLNAQIRAGTDGFISKLLVKQNQPVRKGDPLIETEDPELLARVRIIEAQLEEQRARYAAAGNDRVQAGIIQEEIVHIESRLQSARLRAGELTIRSPGDGRFVMAQATDAAGKFVRRGELLGYVMDLSKVSIQVVVPQGDVDLVRKLTRRVEIKLVERIADTLPAEIVRAVPSATNQLPSLALSSQGGGELALDPSPAADGPRGNEPRSALSHFVFELHLAQPVSFHALGSRIYARFEREPEPLAAQWYRAARRLLLKKFNV